LARELTELPPAFNAKGARVVVIGGGDTGSDCVGTARRQGAREVTQLEIMPKPPETRASTNPWPEWPRVLKTTSSHEEGVDRLWAVSTVGFVPATGDLTRVGQIHCQKVKWLEENGRLIRPEPVAGSDFNQPADLVLLALGFTGVESGSLISDLDLSPDQRGCLPRDAAGRLAPRVYTCGDAALGPSLVVRAMADGLSVAQTVLSDLADKI
jgi:glutamate synthase (NADPH/NADH) small chain